VPAQLPLDILLCALILCAHDYYLLLFHTRETDVSAAAIWSLYEDAETWPSWDAQAEAATRDGPIAAGSTGTMKFRGPDAPSYRLRTSRTPWRR
jgi:hypothetical protein